LRISNIFITLTSVKYNELFRILKEDGWYEVRQKGSHIVMQHSVKSKQLTVPFHAGKEVKKGLLIAILKQADIQTRKR
jgi:predicted RNA binding protein YcfA (HicA-like mRNA interferase family)